MKYILPIIALIAVTTVVACKHNQLQTSLNTRHLKPGEIETEEDRVAREIASGDMDSAGKAQAIEDMTRNMMEARLYDMEMLKKHPIESMPYVLDAATMTASLGNSYKPEDAAVMSLIHTRNYGLFSREVMHDYEYVAYLGQNHGHHVLIYRSLSNVSDVAYPVQYYAATLSDEGFLLSEKMIAALSSPLHITTATVYTNGTIVSQKVDQIWQYAPEQAGYENNKVVKSEVTGKENFHISSNGVIIGG